MVKSVWIVDIEWSDPFGENKDLKKYASIKEAFLKYKESKSFDDEEDKKFWQRTRIFHIFCYETEEQNKKKMSRRRDIVEPFPIKEEYLFDED